MVQPNGFLGLAPESGFWTSMNHTVWQAAAIFRTTFPLRTPLEFMSKCERPFEIFILSYFVSFTFFFS